MIIYILILHFWGGYEGSVSFEKFNTQAACEQVGEATKQIYNHWGVGGVKYQCLKIKD